MSKGYECGFEKGIDGDGMWTRKKACMYVRSFCIYKGPHCWRHRKNKNLKVTLNRS